jgi:hypothetical protein
MGDSTTVMLSIWPEDASHNLPDLQRRLCTAQIGDLRDLTEAWHNVEERGQRWGGTKRPEVDMFGAAYAKLDLERFMRMVLETPWCYPTGVQLLVYRRGASKFVVYEIEHGKWRELRRSRGVLREADPSVARSPRAGGEGE